MKVGFTLGEISAEILSQIAEGKERADAAELAARSDTMAVWATDGAGRIMGYALFGFDADGMVTIYQARAYVAGLGAIAFRALIGAADVLGAPVRVHADKLAPLMRMGQVRQALAAVDLDGVPMGIFGHGV